MHKFKRGFTLAEVLITLAIIGVVAALTIPTLITNSNNQQYISALKKDISILNACIQNNIGANGIDAGSDTSIHSSPSLAWWFISGSGTSYTPNNLQVADRHDAGAGSTVWLKDGTSFTFVDYLGGPCPSLNASSLIRSGAACFVLVDVNGNKGPNTPATVSNNVLTPSDVWLLGISNNTIILPQQNLAEPLSTYMPTSDGTGQSINPPYTATIPANDNAAVMAIEN